MERAADWPPFSVPNQYDSPNLPSPLTAITNQDRASAVAGCNGVAGDISLQVRVAVRDEAVPIAEEMPVVVEEVAVIVDTEIPVRVDIEPTVIPVDKKVIPVDKKPVVPAKTMVVFAKKSLVLLPAEVAVMRKSGVAEMMVFMQAAPIRSTPVPVGHKGRAGVARGDRVRSDVVGYRGRRHEGRSRHHQDRK
jgi:hypothetical protein